MIKHLKLFFDPPILTYSYSLSKELVIAKITEVLKKKTTLFNGSDMTGSFLSSGIFKLNSISPAYTRGVKYSSTLIGQIMESQKGITEIKTQAKPSRVLYFLFFVSIIFGLFYFYKYIQTNALGLLFWSLALLIGGPTFSIGISSVSISSIYERFDMYVDKELNS